MPKTDPPESKTSDDRGYADEWKALSRSAFRVEDEDDFCNQVEQRLHQGAKDYGNGAAFRKLADLLGEAIEESLDSAGWVTFIHAKAGRRSKLKRACRSVVRHSFALWLAMGELKEELEE